MEKLCLVKSEFVSVELDMRVTTYTDQNNSVWFVGNEVARILGYKDPRRAVYRHVGKDDKISTYEIREGETPSLYAEVRPTSQQYAKVLVNEPGLYALVFGSKLELAEKFKRWVFSEVLPSIRKQGFYAFPGALETMRSIEVHQVAELEDDDKKEFRKESVELSNIAKNLKCVERGKLGGSILQKNLADMKADRERLLRNESRSLDKIWELEQELSDITEFVENF